MAWSGFMFARQGSSRGIQVWPIRHLEAVRPSPFDGVPLLICFLFLDVDGQKQAIGNSWVRGIHAAID
jgi:hypothetical protein